MSKIVELLKSFVPPPRSQRANYELGRMRALMEALGNPQDTYPVIHVAGTSGKTSTSYYVAELLLSSGYKTGLTVSPHVEHIGERVQINGKSLEDEQFAKDFLEFAKLIPINLEPTYFEVLVAFAYWYFAKQKVAVAVVETGLGGLLDGTNVVTNPHKTCVITDIGLDHTQILGKTIREISIQKAGIIQKSNNVFMLEQSQEIVEIMRGSAEKKNASFKVFKEYIVSNELPLFQNRNLSLAIQVVESWLKDRDDKLTSQAIASAVSVQVPARMEVLSVRGKKIILDGAHNPQKLAQFVKSFKVMFPGSRPLLLTAMLASGEVRTKSNIKEIININPVEAIVTEFVSLQDIRKKSVSAKLLASELEAAGVKAHTVRDSSEALKLALDSNHDTLVITGSLYLIFDLRPRLISHQS